DAPGYVAGRDRTDAAPLVATTETFDIAVEKPKGAGLVVERAIRPVVHSYSQRGDRPADRVSSAQAECVAHGVWPEASLIDRKQRHPAVAVRSVDFKECVEGHERKAQAQLSDRIFDTQEQRDQQLLGSVVDRNLAKNGRRYRGLGHGVLPKARGKVNGLLTPDPETGGPTCESRGQSL